MFVMIKMDHYMVQFSEKDQVLKLLYFELGKLCDRKLKQNSFYQEQL